MNRPEGFERNLGPGGLEVRTMLGGEVRASDSEPRIEGLGSPYDSPTRISGFFSEWDEQVASGAWTDTIASDDIRSMFNHDPNFVLGRTSAGTLTLNDTDEGLRYSVDINPDDPNAMSVHAKVARGDVTGSSVWFVVSEEKWTFPDDNNDLEVPMRTILKANLFEVGPVTFPAFPQTTAGARALDGALRAGGITRPSSRAKWAYELSLHPEEAEARILELFRRNQKLASNVCDQHRADTETSAATAADDTVPPGWSTDEAKRRLAKYGTPPVPV